MYKELREAEIKTCTQIAFEHPGKAYLMINIDQPFVNGVTLEPRGSLYAISDEKELDKLYKTSDYLEKQGIKILVDTLPLGSGKQFFTG